MALFGLESDAETGCRQAMAAAYHLERLEYLNRTLAAGSVNRCVSASASTPVR
jgi:hypothetical protein